SDVSGAQHWNLPGAGPGARRRLLLGGLARGRSGVDGSDGTGNVRIDAWLRLGAVSPAIERVHARAATVGVVERPAYRGSSPAGSGACSRPSRAPTRAPAA